MNRNLVCKLEGGVEVYEDQVDDVIDALSDPITPEQRVNIAVKRSEALLSFYSAERRAGADPLTANERMHEFAKRLDALPEQYEAELESIRQIMESVK